MCPVKSLVLQALFDGSHICFKTLSGETMFEPEASQTDTLSLSWKQLMRSFSSTPKAIEVVLPDGKLLRKVLAQDSLAAVSAVWPGLKRRRTD